MEWTTSIRQDINSLFFLNRQFSQFAVTQSEDDATYHAQGEKGKNTQIIINLNHEPKAYLYGSHSDKKHRNDKEKEEENVEAASPARPVPPPGARPPSDAPSGGIIPIAPPGPPPTSAPSPPPTSYGSPDLLTGNGYSLFDLDYQNLDLSRDDPGRRRRPPTSYDVPQIPRQSNPAARPGYGDRRDGGRGHGHHSGGGRPSNDVPAQSLFDDGVYQVTLYRRPSPNQQPQQQQQQDAAVPTAPTAGAYGDAAGNIAHTEAITYQFSQSATLFQPYRTAATTTTTPTPRPPADAPAPLPTYGHNRRPQSDAQRPPVYVQQRPLNPQPPSDAPLLTPSYHQGPPAPLPRPLSAPPVAPVSAYQPNPPPLPSQPGPPASPPLSAPPVFSSGNIKYNQQQQQQQSAPPVSRPSYNYQSPLPPVSPPAAPPGTFQSAPPIRPSPPAPSYGPPPQPQAGPPASPPLQQAPPSQGYGPPPPRQAAQPRPPGESPQFAPPGPPGGQDVVNFHVRGTLQASLADGQSYNHHQQQQQQQSPSADPPSRRPRPSYAAPNPSSLLPPPSRDFGEARSDDEPLERIDTLTAPLASSGFGDRSSSSSYGAPRPRPQADPPSSSYGPPPPRPPADAPRPPADPPQQILVQNPPSFFLQQNPPRQVQTIQTHTVQQAPSLIAVQSPPQVVSAPSRPTYGHQQQTTALSSPSILSSPTQQQILSSPILSSPTVLSSPTFLQSPQFVSAPTLASPAVASSPAVHVHLDSHRQSAEPVLLQDFSSGYGGGGGGFRLRNPARPPSFLDRLRLKCVFLCDFRNTGKKK